MRTSPILLSLALSASGGALGAEVMTADAFDAYTQGSTFVFSENGTDYGAERYLPNRRVEWSFLDGQCQVGRWYAKETAICFVYEAESGLQTEPQCWEFTQRSQGLSARYVGNGQSPATHLKIYEARHAQERLICLGPEVGM